MVKKIFPVEPLPVDKERLMEVVQYYNKVIINRDYKEKLGTSIFFLVTILFAFIFFFKISIPIKILYLLPIVTISIAIFALILKKNLTKKVRSVLSILEMLIIIIFLINMIQPVIYKIMHYDLITIFLGSYLTCGFIYYMGYMLQYKKFKVYFAMNQKPDIRLSRAGLIAVIASILTRYTLRLTSAEFVIFIAISGLLWMTALFSRSLISYLQYDNIQEAKKELGLEVDN